MPEEQLKDEGSTVMPPTLELPELAFVLNMVTSMRTSITTRATMALTRKAPTRKTVGLALAGAIDA